MATPPASGPDEFGDPGTDGPEGDAPALHQLVGRLILWRPRKSSLGQNTKYQSTELQDTMQVDLIVLDGPPIDHHLNGDTKAVTPFATGPKVAPFYLGNIRVKAVPLKKLRAYHDSADPRATCLGRLVETPPRTGGKPYQDLANGTDQDKALARKVLPMWDELKAAAAAVGPVRPDQFGGPTQQQAPAGPPPGWTPPPAQQAAPQGPPDWSPAPSYAGLPPTPAQQAALPPGWPQPAAQAGPPPGWDGQPTH